MFERAYNAVEKARQYGESPYTAALRALYRMGTPRALCGRPNGVLILASLIAEEGPYGFRFSREAEEAIAPLLAPAATEYEQ